MRRSSLARISATFLFLAGAAATQTIHRSRSVIVNGHDGKATIYEIDGKSFVDLETLVRISNGSLAYEKDRIVVIIPPAPGGPATSVEGIPHASAAGLSPEFMRSAVQELSIIKDWTTVMAYAVQRGVPGDGARLQLFRDRATEGVHLAKVAAHTNSDHSALTLLMNQFDAVSAWTDRLVRERRSMDTGKYSLSENAIAADEQYQKIASCTTFLGTMLTSGSFQDDYACHLHK